MKSEVLKKFYLDNLKVISENSDKKINDSILDLIEKTEVMKEQGFKNYEEFGKKYIELDYLGKGATCTVYSVAEINDRTKNYALKKMEVS